MSAVNGLVGYCFMNEAGDIVVDDADGSHTHNDVVALYPCCCCSWQTCEADGDGENVARVFLNRKKPPKVVIMLPLLPSRGWKKIPSLFFFSTGRFLR